VVSNEVELLAPRAAHLTTMQRCIKRDKLQSKKVRCRRVTSHSSIESSEKQKRGAPCDYCHGDNLVTGCKAAFIQAV
jgi:hypothetical protein